MKSRIALLSQLEKCNWSSSKRLINVLISFNGDSVTMIKGGKIVHWDDEVRLGGYAISNGIVNKVKELEHGPTVVLIHGHIYGTKWVWRPLDVIEHVICEGDVHNLPKSYHNLSNWIRSHESIVIPDILIRNRIVFGHWAVGVTNVSRWESLHSTNIK